MISKGLNLFFVQTWKILGRNPSLHTTPLLRIHYPCVCSTGLVEYPLTLLICLTLIASFVITVHFRRKLSWNFKWTYAMTRWHIPSFWLCRENWSKHMTSMLPIPFEKSTCVRYLEVNRNTRVNNQNLFHFALPGLWSSAYNQTDTILMRTLKRENLYF